MRADRLTIGWPCPHGVHGGMYCATCEDIIELLEEHMTWMISAVVPEAWKMWFDGRDFIRDTGEIASFLEIVNDGDLEEITTLLETIEGKVQVVA